MRTSEARIIASLCRRSLEHFVKEFFSVVAPGEVLKWNWHISLMTSALQECYERLFAGKDREYDLLTNVPPRTTKSIVHSVMAPMWAWTRMPHFCFIGASYSHVLAINLSRKSRDIVKSEKFQACFPEIQLREDQDTKGYFMNTQGGERFSVGSNGTVTGLHGHVIGIDDPIDPNRTSSEAEMFGINNWISQTLLQRKKDKRTSFVDMVMQRLHQNDPSAVMLKGIHVRHICLPATCDDPVQHPIIPAEHIKNYKDGLLDPQSLPRSVLEELKLPSNLGMYGYAGQYLQRPVPEGGGKFQVHKLRWGPMPSEFKMIARFWDKAASVTKRSAFTVGLKMGRDFEDRYWVMSIVRGQWDSSSREIRILQTARSDTRSVVIGVEQEPGSGGKDSALATVKRLSGYHVVVVPARGSKELRADEFSVQVNNGNCWISEHLRQGNEWMGWAKDFVEELTYWPFSTCLDQGDAAGGAFTILSTPVIEAGPIQETQETSLEERQQEFLVRGNCVDVVLVE